MKLLIYKCFVIQITFLIALPAAEWLPTIIAEARRVLRIPVEVCQLEDANHWRVGLCARVMSQLS